MPDPKYPFLLLPSSVAAEKGKRSGGSPGLRFPGRNQQIERIGPQIQRLEHQFARQSAILQRTLAGAPIEQIVVLETIGSVEKFYRTVERSGLQFLFDVDGAPATVGTGFRRDDTDQEPLPTKLYLILADQRAIEEILRLWGDYRRRGRTAFAHGFKRWADVFDQLKEIRLWDLRDRLDGDTRQYWTDRLEAGDEFVRTEIDIWYSDSEQRTLDRSRELAHILVSGRSRIIHEVDLHSIRYRGILADISAQQVRDTLRDLQHGLGIAGQVMYFRPQLRAMAVSEGGETSGPTNVRHVPTGDPVVAILDGCPLENHSLLGPRIIVDDPEDFARQAPAQDRVHGTSMASIVLHGDLSGQSPTIQSRVVCHPILIPDLASADRPRPEISPANRLLIDIIHVAVHRLLEGSAPETPVAPTVRVIQLAVGDINREFLRELSPLARLLDWLSWKYKVLFVVPSGNSSSQGFGIELESPRAQFSALSPEQRSVQALRSLERDNSTRRLISPAESINSLTVGGIYTDDSTFQPSPNRFELFREPWPSPEARSGPGFLRAIKPDLVAPSGRRLFYEKPGNTHPRAVVVPVNGVSSAPGIASATPGGITGALDQFKYSCGTSNSSALTSHTLAHAHTAISGLRASGPARTLLPELHDAVLLKAMVVHACHWPHSPALEDALQLASNTALERQRRLERLFGNGILNIERTRGCPDERATFIATGQLRADEGAKYLVPLPQVITARALWRRLTITLAWFSPINPQHRDYRRAMLWFTAEHEHFKGSVAGADWQATRRGTVQHLVWQGERPISYAANAEIPIKVSCAADAGTLNEIIPYALCVSIEVAEGTGINVYEELAARVTPRVPIRPRGR